MTQNPTSPGKKKYGSSNNNLQYIYIMILFSQHALLKLGHRKLQKAFVIKTLNNPELEIPSYGDRMIAFKKFGKNYFKVVFRKENNNIIIIT